MTNTVMLNLFFNIICALLNMYFYNITIDQCIIMKNIKIIILGKYKYTLKVYRLLKIINEFIY